MATVTRALLCTRVGECVCVCVCVSPPPRQTMTAFVRVGLRDNGPRLCMAVYVCLGEKVRDCDRDCVLGWRLVKGPPVTLRSTRCCVWRFVTSMVSAAVHVPPNSNTRQHVAVSAFGVCGCCVHIIYITVFDHWVFPPPIHAICECGLVFFASRWMHTNALHGWVGGWMERMDGWGPS